MKQLILLLLVGCTDQPPYDIELKGQVTANGDDLHLRLVETTGAVVISNEWGPFERTITYGDLIEQGKSYQLTAFLDRDFDQKCGAADKVWQIGIAPANDKVSIDFDTAFRTPNA